MEIPTNAPKPVKEAKSVMPDRDREPERSHQPQKQNQQHDKVAFVIQPEPCKTWMDRLVDAMIGDDSRHHRYALVCQRCHAHNGLALPDEIMTLSTFSFVC